MIDNNFDLTAFFMTVCFLLGIIAYGVIACRISDYVCPLKICIIISGIVCLAEIFGAFVLDRFIDWFEIHKK